ncbi:flagellar hook-associated protein FlgK [Fictibacillus arsenicus]|uniref:Flagellar hook-associated protein 1 n=1 Tax=Fictibacillus arsenicus TaxID=255247 RepID=A0A1B1Z8A9_9BACL|nr:flagellar hook-associated protein FlgK [Fictibacillus arsenicus]ANX13697.1 flagellar hook-associated protein FlgK [Fictibacillus arsenicus]
MRSTFHGLETARRGMFTQQTALQVTGNNISNANTPGYSRQRVNFEQTEPYPAAAMNRPNIPGQMGTGVKAGSIQRVREGFLDVQFRTENNKLGYWGAKAEGLEKMEDIMNEPSDNGLSKTLDRFWQSLQDLAVNPEDSGARSVVRQRGIAVAETFNYLSNSLYTIKKDMESQIDITKLEVNSLTTQINNINKQISEIEPHGYLPNDLYDERDMLVDRLSELVNIKVTSEPSSDDPSPMAAGKYTIELISGDGTQSLGKLVDGAALAKSDVNYNIDSTTGKLTKFTLGAPPSDITTLKVGGRLSGLTDSFNNTYPTMLNDLDKLAKGFAVKFNEVHSNGYSLTNTTNIDFFALEIPGAVSEEITSTTPIAGFASRLTIHDDIKNKIENIAAGLTTSDGDGDNAQLLSDVKNDSDVKLKTTYEGMIGRMAVESQEAVRLMDNSNVLKSAVDSRRQSISGVSLDEEMTNMIQFQHAYNASARNITVIDEMLDKIINGMGVGGR